MTTHEHDYRIDPYTRLMSSPPQMQAYCIAGVDLSKGHLWERNPDCDEPKLYIPDANYPPPLKRVAGMAEWSKYVPAKTYLYPRDRRVQNLMRWLTPNPGLPTQQRSVAELAHSLAATMLHQLPDGPELIEGLRKLLEAKDCFVRASLGPETE